MLPETKESLIFGADELAAYPLLPAPITVRFRFSKTGSLQYISHLDLQRTFGRVVLRAGIPVWYTKGFNPHPKLVFALPLPVGTESVTEYLDLRVDREMDPSEMMTRFNSCLTDEMKILDAYLPEHPFSEIAFAEYEIDLRSAGIGAREALSSCDVSSSSKNSSSSPSGVSWRVSRINSPKISSSSSSSAASRSSRV